ncbi:MAG: ATP-grasp domain-containing protein [Oscillospiraceae bacterium]|nr:ATP-grasp domain-containing protein [Oscillospiraceae bacterium]
MKIEPSDMLTAVVVGHDHQNTLGVIRSLGEEGIRVKTIIISDGEFSSTAYSKYIDEVFIIRITELTNTLLTLAAGIDERIPLIPCGDDVVACILSEFSKLNGLYILPVAESGSNTLRLMNKSEMLRAAYAAGLNVPNWVTVHYNEFNLLEQRCEKLRFPCMLKPVSLRPGGVFEFRILRTMDELLDSMDYINSNCSVIIVQEYIQKVKEFGVNGCRLYSSGETVFGGVIEKKRFSQSSLGSTTAGTILPDKYGICDAAKRFVEHINYRGIFDTEFITDGEIFYFVEMNFRNGGYGYAYTKAGRNFPAIWAKEAIGFDIENCVDKPLRNVFFVNESADLQNVFAKKISLIDWLRDVLRADAHMYINRKDMKPLLKKILRK